MEKYHRLSLSASNNEWAWFFPSIEPLPDVPGIMYRRNDKLLVILQSNICSLNS